MTPRVVVTRREPGVRTTASRMPERSAEKFARKTLIKNVFYLRN
jgi:hypothetical protein